MKKITKLFFLSILAIFLVSCSLSSKTYPFNHELFSLQLPADFINENNILTPKVENDFPEIAFQIENLKSEISPEKYLEEEKKKISDFFGQTEGMGKIIESSSITLAQKNGIKFIVQIKGRSIDNDEGFINIYYYSLYDAKNNFRFWAGASDKEKYQEIQKNFEKIMQSISFK